MATSAMVSKTSLHSSRCLFQGKASNGLSDKFLITVRSGERGTASATLYPSDFAVFLEASKMHNRPTVLGRRFLNYTKVATD